MVWNPKLNMVERVAHRQALFDKQDWLAMPKYNRERYMERARLFLTIMLEPTDTMRALGDEFTDTIYINYIKAAMVED